MEKSDRSQTFFLIFWLSSLNLILIPGAKSNDHPCYESVLVMRDWNWSLLNILFDTDLQKQLLSLRIEKDRKLSQFMPLSQSKKDKTEKIIKFNFQ